MSTHSHAQCRDLLERLSLYIDGDLTPRQQRALVAHLRRCPCCDQFAESLRRTVELCRQAGHSRLPSAVRARARARLKALLHG